MDQNDPELIKAIRNKVLWRPPSADKKLNLNNVKSSGIPSKDGFSQYDQPIFVEKILKENDMWPEIKHGTVLYLGTIHKQRRKDFANF